MKALLSPVLAGNILLVAFGALAVFHVLVLAGLVPADIVWGGHVEEGPASRVGPEIGALILSLLFMLVIAVRLGYVGTDRHRKQVTGGVWVIFAYLALNTVGNMLAQSSVETLIFTPLTLLMALLALRLAVEKTP